MVAGKEQDLIRGGEVVKLLLKLAKEITVTNKEQNMSDRDVMWMEGVLEGVEDKLTGSGKPKKVVKLKENEGDSYARNVNFCGDDIAKVPDNILQYRGYRIQAAYTIFEIPGRDTKMRMGTALVLCNEKGELNPLPAQAAPQATYTPETVAPPVATLPSNNTPPVTSGPTAGPPIKEPVVASNETSRTLSITRLAVLKSPILVALQGNTPTVGKTRILCDYFVDYCLSDVKRISGSQHRILESKIAEVVGPENRKLFKVFLAEEASCSEMGESGSIHLTDMSYEHADKVIGPWWNALFTAWRAWKQHKDNENNPDIAPAEEGQSPQLNTATETEEEVPDFMKQ